MLATIADVAARLGRPITEDETPRVQAFIDDATALIEEYCGLDFTLHQDETFNLEPVCGPQLDIPRRYPFLTVATVSIDGTVVTDWVLKRRALWRICGWDANSIEIAGTWGYSTPPATLKAVVCAEVIRWLAVSPGVSMERVGELATEYTGASTVQSLSPAAKTALSRYRPKLASIGLVREPRHGRI